MLNFTEEGFDDKFLAIACAPPFYGNHFMHSLAALNILLAITATLGNALILVALRKETSLHSPSKLMFQCLAVTDLCVGVLAQPLLAIQLISITYERHGLCYTVEVINKIAGSSFSGVSLLTLAAISVERLLALRLGLRYRRIITLRRTCGIVISFWILCLATASMRWFWKRVLFSRVISMSIYSSLTISAFSYLTIYLTLRRHHNTMYENATQGQPKRDEKSRRIARYKKTVSLAFYVQLAMTALYLPYAIVEVIGRQSPFLNLAARLAITLVFLNSSLNPALYCWKINSVREAVKGIIKQFSVCNFLS